MRHDFAVAKYGGKDCATILPAAVDWLKNLPFSLVHPVTEKAQNLRLRALIGGADLIILKWIFVSKLGLSARRGRMGRFSQRMAGFAAGALLLLGGSAVAFAAPPAAADPSQAADAAAPRNFVLLQPVILDAPQPLRVGAERLRPGYGALTGAPAGAYTLTVDQLPHLNAGEVVDALLRDRAPAASSGGLDNRAALNVLRAATPFVGQAPSLPLSTLAVKSGVSVAGDTGLPLLRRGLTAAPGSAFSADLDVAARLRGNDMLNLVANQFSAVMPFAVGVSGPSGPVYASGYAVRMTTPELISSLYLKSDRNLYALRDVAVSAPVLPGVNLNLGFNLNMSGRVNAYDASASPAYDGLFMAANAVNSPYVSLSNGAAYVGGTLALSDSVQLRLGQAELTPSRDPFAVDSYALLDQLDSQRAVRDLRAGQASVAGLSWQFADWGGLGLVASRTTERNGLLGNFVPPALSVADRASTSALGVSARVGFGDGWVTTASYSEGVTQLDLKPSNLIRSAGNLHSRAYGIAVAKHGLFGDDSLGFAVTRPIQIYAGAVDLGAVDRSALNSALDRISLATAKPETDIELGYVTTFMDGALALQANAAYQMNLQGQTGTNALSLVSRAKIKF